VKVFLGLHKTVDDKWTSEGAYLPEPAGVLCQFDDGSAVAATHDGRVLRFDGRGVQIPVAGEDPPVQPERERHEWNPAEAESIRRAWAANARQAGS